MKQILIIILFILTSNRIIAQNDILYSFQDEKTEFIGFKDKNGIIKIEAKFSILTVGKFINIIPVTEYTNQGTENYYLLKNGEKVGYDSLWVYDITYDCEKEGFIRYRDGKRKIGLFNKDGNVTIPSEYMYLSQVQNSVIKAMKNGKTYLIDTTNHILIKNFDESRYIDYFSLEIEEKPSLELIKRSYLSEDGKYYNFVDNYRLFENWFLNSFTKNLEKKDLINNIYEKPIYWTDDKGWSTKNSQDFINDNYQVLKEKFLQFLKEEATQWTKDQQKELQLIIGHTSNYDNLYLHILTSRKSESWKTQSTNPNILAIYEILVESENHDTDYWWCGIGASDMAQVFYKFTPKDWQELEEDLKYWTNFQLEMFIYGILDEGLSNQQQFDLIIPLLKIGKLPDRQSNDIAFTVLDEMYFLDILFEKLKEEPTTLPKMKEIFELLEVEAYDEAFLILKKKIYG